MQIIQRARVKGRNISTGYVACFGDAEAALNVLKTPGDSVCHGTSLYSETTSAREHAKLYLPQEIRQLSSLENLHGLLGRVPRGCVISSSAPIFSPNTQTTCLFQRFRDLHPSARGSITRAICRRGQIPTDACIKARAPSSTAPSSRIGTWQSQSDWPSYLELAS